ncbi:MAG: peptidase MA family metallohydrolase [Bacillota bacterium]
MGRLVAHRPRFWGWLISNIMLALVFIGITFSLKYPNAPKAIAYTFVREIAKTRMQISTSDWKSEESSRFILKYQPQDTAVAGIVIQAADKFYDPVSSLLGYYPSSKIALVLYPDRASLGKSFGWSSNQGAMGVYWAGVIRVLSPRDWVDSDNIEDMTTTFDSAGPMAHEYAHLVVDYITRGNYTRWFTEGVAQYVEREVTGFEFPAPDTPDTFWYPLSKMDVGFDDLGDQALAYREALAMVDFMVQLKGFSTVKYMMRDLGQGQTLNQAMKKEFGLTLGQFEKAFYQQEVRQQGAA